MKMVQPQRRIYRNDVSAETREKQSIAHQGRKHSNDTKQKISKAMCDYWAKLPTLYFSQAKDTDMKMRIYDKGTGNTELGYLGLRCKTLRDVLYDTLGEFGAIQA